MSDVVCLKMDELILLASALVDGDLKERVEMAIKNVSNVMFIIGALGDLRRKDKLLVVRDMLQVLKSAVERFSDMVDYRSSDLELESDLDYLRRMLLRGSEK